jgi:hypothetical protein
MLNITLIAVYGEESQSSFAMNPRGLVPERPNESDGDEPLKILSIHDRHPDRKCCSPISMDAASLPMIAPRDGSFDYVREWYHLISDLTFPSWFIPLSADEAHTLLSMIKTQVAKKPIPDDLAVTFAQFTDRLMLEFARVQSEAPPGSRFFARLGSRSPKDAVPDGALSMQRFADLLFARYTIEYDKLPSSPSRADRELWMSGPSHGIDFQIIEEITIAALSIQSISELIELFLKSIRVHQDLRADKDMQAQTEIVLRQWDPRIESHLEFRSFVCRGELTGLTQYDDRNYFEDVFENKELILDTIRTLFETGVKPAMASSSFPENSYVADYAIIFQKSDGKIVGAEAVMIELNRFNFQTGAALFEWHRDLEVLIGVKPFEFRIRTPEQVVDVDWDQHVSGYWGSSVWRLMRKVKADVVQSRKAWYEKLFTWRSNE